MQGSLLNSGPTLASFLRPFPAQYSIYVGGILNAYNGNRLKERQVIDWSLLLAYRQLTVHSWGMKLPKTSYLSDLSDAEGAIPIPYLTLIRKNAPRRKCPLGDLFDALRYFVKTGGRLGLPVR